MTDATEPPGATPVTAGRDHRTLTACRRWMTTPSRLGFLAYAAVHLLVVVGLPTPRFPDSAHYLVFSVTGGASEPPTVPLLYSIAWSDPVRIALQTLIAALAWWALASVVSNRVADRRVRIAIRCILLALGVVGPVANWNTMILSESLSISLTVLLIAVWMRYVERPRWQRSVEVILVSVLWTDARQAHIYLSVLVVAFVGVVVLARYRRNVRSWVLVGSLLAITLSGFAIVDNNHYVGSGIIADTMEDRILPNAGYTAWFVNAGMPYNATIQAASGGTFGDALVAIPIWETWADEHGTRTYLDFIATHPRYTLWQPLASFLGEQPSLDVPTPPLYAPTQPDPTPSMLSPNANYGRHRNVLPAPISELLFDPGQFGDVVLLGALAAIAAVESRRRRGRDRRLFVPLVVVASTIPHGYFVYLLSGVGEQDRISIVLAVALRVALWSIVAFSVDRIISAPDAPVAGGVLEAR